ncbi:hypothetical protein Tsubulata_028752 [Turnera subulata]|uniref:F-box domain-containing protein n=1 Tax=Turnera subulata TaxID=218843 RepID=A0A9Q0FRD7_9ROSI|nr:hypothetical protein Tsubulata_028752 [Turnera subulata]
MRTELVPDEVCLDIMGRMPVKSVVRFMCLNKSWQSLILDNSLYLNDLHSFHHNKSGTSCNYLVNRRIRPVLPLLLAAADDDEERANDNDSTYKGKLGSPYMCLSLHDGRSLMQYEELDNPCMGKSCTIIIGSYNGLVLVMDDDSGLYLWNPSIRKVKALPARSGPDCERPLIGFGFCQTNKNFKVVYMVTLFDPGTGEMASQDVDVYSLASDSWESLSTHETTTLVPLGPHDYHCHITFDGNPHWLVQKKEDDTMFIVSFDFDSNQFRTISKEQLPVLYGGAGEGLRLVGSMHLCTYKDMVCILRRTRRFQDSDLDSVLIVDCEVWVLKGYYGSTGSSSVDESSSWSLVQVLLLRDLPYGGIPLDVFTHDGHLLLLDLCHTDAIISAETTNNDNDDHPPSAVFKQHKIFPHHYHVEATLAMQQMFSYTDSLFLL